MDRDADFHGEFELVVADEFRHRLQMLRSAESEERLFSLKALDMQPRTDRDTSYRIRVTDNFRLEVEFRNDEERRDRRVIITSMTPNYNDNKGDLS
jgi:plasmid maintenance system killer protein